MPSPLSPLYVPTRKMIIIPGAGGWCTLVTCSTYHQKMTQTILQESESVLYADELALIK